MRYLLLLVLPLVISSCDSLNPFNNDPVRISARFDAITKNGDTIPIPHTGNDDCGFDYRVVTFELDGTYLHTLRTSFEAEDPGGCTLPRRTGVGTYVITNYGIFTTQSGMGINDSGWIEYKKSFKEVRESGDGVDTWVFERVD